MDAFEPVRDAARKLHADAIACGADALQSRSLVEAAARHLDLDLAWLPPSDPALKGARAVLDVQSGTICCIDEETETVRTTLVAHEIGHAVIHSASSECSTEDIDPSRSIEVAPVGLQRIEDYGGRERRELQANVFAREFLLPREHARRLYLDERASATSIADRLRLPKDLVRQQLLDALLLPAKEAPPAQASADTTRNDSSQDRAAAHRGSAFQLQAGPGTGKTRTLIKKVRALLDDGIDPSSVLVLTFSNRAAGELSERIAAASPDAAPRIWIGTFHAFGLDLVRRYHDRFGLPPDPPLFDRSDAIEVLEEILPTLPLLHYRNLWDPALVLRDIIAAISRAKDELAGPAAYRTLAERMLDRATDDDARKAAAKALEVARVYDLYEQELRRRGAVDFGDLVMRPALLLEDDETVRRVLQLRHRHVLVDEYQDVNRASARLLHAVAGDGRRLWVVGDSRQSIYRFRGASATNMGMFASEYPNATADQLSVNYRSSDEIVRTLTSVAPRLGASQEMLPLAFNADRGPAGIRPQVRRFDTLDQEAEGIAASVTELAQAGVSFRDQAVLCRSNSRLNEIAFTLEARGIPVLHLGSFFEREEIRDLLALLSLAIDPFGDGLARVGAMPRYDIPLQDAHAACLRLRESSQPAATKLGDLLGVAGVSADGARGLKTLRSDLAGLKSNASPWDFLTTYLLDRTDMVAALATARTVAERMRAIATWQFLNFVRDRGPTGVGPPIQRTLDRVRQLVLLAEERDLRQVPAAALHIDAVRLMTVHGSKGLEFEAVHLPGLTVSSFPSSHRGQRCPAPDGLVEGTSRLSSDEQARSAHEHEEQCLFFVAVSRARTHLRLYLARKQPNGKNRSPSPFLAWIPPTLIDDFADPATLPLPRGSSHTGPVAITWPNDWDVTDARLRTYEKCPRRFFYTHVLDLGGKRKPTAFTRTHDCLYDFIAWLAETRVDDEADDVMAAQEFERLWQAKGPTDHAYAAEYRDLADRLVTVLVRLGAGKRFRRSEPLAIDFENGRVIVEPDEMAELPDGTVVLRRVRTGYKRTDEYDRLDYSLYHMAAREHYRGGYQVEALHLTDEHAEPVTISESKIANRRAKSSEMLAGITAGMFPPEIDAVSCPRCPHFFICAATCRGPLSLA